MADDNKPEEGEKSAVPFGAEITNLASVAIQVHEVFLELQNSGFTKKEALTLTGVLLASSSVIDMETYVDYRDVEPPEGDSSDTLEVDNFGNWDIIFDEYDKELPEEDENLE